MALSDTSLDHESLTLLRNVTHWKWPDNASFYTSGGPPKLLKSTITIQALLEDAARLQNESGLHVIFLPSIEKTFDRAKFSRLADRMARTLYLPQWFFEKIGWDSNGFFGSRINEDDKQSTYSTFSRYLAKHVHFKDKTTKQRMVKAPETPDAMSNLEIDYEWSYMAFATFWRSPKFSETSQTNTESTANGKADARSERISNPTVMLICFDLSAEAQKIVEDILEDIDPVHCISNPFHILGHISWAVVREFDNAVWGFQPKVRFVEKTRFEFGEDKNKRMPVLNSKYNFIHDLSRHVLHVTETLGVSARTLASMLRDCAEMETAHHSSETVTKVLDQWDDQMVRNLRLSSDLMANIQSRGQAFVDRLHSEAQVAFSIVAAYDAEQRQNEGKSLADTVAVLTLFFLPGTFVSGFFGMNFFTLAVDKSGAHWMFTRQFWMFFACTVPLTIIGLILFTLDINLIEWTKINLTVPIKKFFVRIHAWYVVKRKASKEKKSKEAAHHA